MPEQRRRWRAGEQDGLRGSAQLLVCNLRCFSQRRLGLSLILSRALRPRRINVDDRSQREHADVVAEQIDRGLHCSERLRRSVDAHDHLVAPAARFAWREAYRWRVMGASGTAQRDRYHERAEHAPDHRPSEPRMATPTHGDPGEETGDYPDGEDDEQR